MGWLWGRGQGGAASTVAGDDPAAPAHARRGQTRGLTADECAAILATCTRRRRSGCGLEREETAERRGRQSDEGVCRVRRAPARHEEGARDGRGRGKWWLDEWAACYERRAGPAGRR